MRTPLIAVLFALSPVLALADPPLLRETAHLRPLTHSAAALVANATGQSDIIRSLVKTIDESDVVVYVSDGMAGGINQPRACLSFISQAAGVRYLLIRIDRWLAPPWVRIADLGHELQHAVEVARAPEVRDATSLGRLYRRIGWEGDPGRFESSEAQAVGSRVLSQLTWVQQ